LNVKSIEELKFELELELEIGIEIRKKGHEYRNFKNSGKVQFYKYHNFYFCIQNSKKVINFRNNNFKL